MDGLLKDLNDRQREAVTAPMGPVLVLAGAGSGKTRVLTYRIAYLIARKLCKPEEILALTFTNKAAGEMRGRISKLLIPAISDERLAIREEPKVSDKRQATSDLEKIPPQSQIANRQSPAAAAASPIANRQSLPVTMGTFHSVCARILRHEIGKLSRGYGSNFVIYDTEDTARLLKQVVLELGISERWRPEMFGHYISGAKNRLLRPDELMADNRFLSEKLKEVFELYQSRLVAHNAVDFDDLLALTCELFAQNPPALRKYQNRFRYILVDEYQDTNHAQYVLLKLLADKRQNLFVVGDDAQSIYGFRGANMQNILDFKRDYPKAKVVMLEQNYRSTQTILDAATSVIRLNPLRYEKNLWTKNDQGGKVYLYEAADETAESAFVLRSILDTNHSVILSPQRKRGAKDLGDFSAASLLQNDKTRELQNDKAELVYETEDTPILNRLMRNQRNYRSSLPIYRPINGQATNLRETAVLYRTHAQSRPFEEQLLASGIPYQIVGGIKFYERREIKDLLAYLRLAVNPRDLVSLNRVINIPARGIGSANFRLIAEGLRKYDHNFSRVLNNLEKLGLQPKALAGARDFFRVMNLTGKLAQRKTLSDLMHLILTRTGYKDYLLDGSVEGQERWENVEELFNVAARYRHLPWAEGLKSFLEEAALMSDLDALEEGGDKLTLMTLHSAKGLEFASVFLVGLEEGLLPHSRSLLSPQELAEEIRLAYVGMTRAKQRLFLSYAQNRQTYGEYKRAMPSRIIKAIPKNLVERISND